MKRYINLFQMELFYFISGYCFLYSWKRRNSIKLIFSNKLKRLIIPFAAFALFWLLPIRYLLHFPNYDGISLIEALGNIVMLRDAGHLWFLPVLFSIMMICAVMNRTVKNLAIIVSLSVVLHFFSYICSNPLLRNTFYYIIFFVIGELLNTYNVHGKQHSVLILIAATSLSVIIYYLNGIHHHIILDLALRMIIILIIFTIIPDKEFKTVKFLNKNSFGIYLIHSPLLLFGLTYFRNYPPPGLRFFTIDNCYSPTTSYNSYNQTRRVQLGYW